MKKVLILGNGFDLNLGLKTSYSDFVKSEHFEKIVRHKDNYLINRIYTNFRLNNWIDLEEELKRFAIEQSGNRKSLLDVSTELEELRHALIQYLKGLDYSKINKKSAAAQLLDLVCRNKEDYEIYSYNYTDLNEIVRRIRPESENSKDSIRYTHVHGCLKDNSIIIGFEDDVDIDDEYCYMIKTFSPHYASHKVRYALENADEIIFFGHSLGSTDYHYFSKLFHDKSDIGLQKEKSVKIRILTANRESKYEILKQLRNMNNKQTNILYDLNDFKIICCGGNNMNSSQVVRFLTRLELEHETEKRLFCKE